MLGVIEDRVLVQTEKKMTRMIMGYAIFSDNEDVTSDLNIIVTFNILVSLSNFHFVEYIF